MKRDRIHIVQYVEFCSNPLPFLKRIKIQEYVGIFYVNGVCVMYI